MAAYIYLHAVRCGVVKRGVDVAARNRLSWVLLVAWQLGALASVAEGGEGRGALGRGAAIMAYYRCSCGCAAIQ